MSGWGWKSMIDSMIGDHFDVCLMYVKVVLDVRGQFTSARIHQRSVQEKRTNLVNLALYEWLEIDDCR